MAETVHLYLKANGSDIKGESQQVSLGRRDSIECIYYEHEVISAREAAPGMVTGRRRYTPLLVRKRIDKSSPLLMKALVENARIDALFKFFRPSPAGDGTTEQFYTVELREGNIGSVKQVVLDILNPAAHMEPPLEEVTFVFKNITWTYTNGGVTHTDSWKENH